MIRKGVAGKYVIDSDNEHNLMVILIMLIAMRLTFTQYILVRCIYNCSRQLYLNNSNLLLSLFFMVAAILLHKIMVFN